jgi:hypothetical protein
LIGIAALFVAVVCLFASLGVLLGSRDAPVDSLYFQPTVYLAIATAMSNTALNAALAQAAPISWWYKACKGSTIQDLELEWEAGQSFPRAIYRSLRQGRYFNLLTISSMIVALVVVDGPLLQRSSSVHSATVNRAIVQNISIAPELPTGFSGSKYSSDVQGTSVDTDEVMRAFANDAPIRSTARCAGLCTMTVRAPGAAKHGCVTKQWAINETILTEPDSSWGSGYDGYMPSKPLMFVGFFSFTPGMPMTTGAGPEDVVLTVGRADIQGFDGAYTETNCSLRSAVVEYDVILEGHDLSFAAPPSSGRVIALANNTFVNGSSNATQPLTWTALQTYLQIYTSANASFETRLPKGVMTYPVSETMNALVMKHLVAADGSTIIVSDPTNEVLNNLNEIMFRGGVLAAQWYVF